MSRHIIIVPPGSTTPIVVPVPFVPASVYVIAGPEGGPMANSKGLAVAPADNSCLSYELVAPGPMPLGQAVPGYSWYVRETGPQEAGGTITFQIGSVTIVPDVNTLTNPAHLFLEVLE